MAPQIVSPTSSQFTASADSAVSSHVALWALLTIVMNTMAQSATIIGDNTLYYHSSPIYTLGHALWTIVQTIVCSYRLKIHSLSLKQLLQIATRTSRESWDSKHPPGLSSDNVHSSLLSTPHARTWPRWLFFVMGPLPAVVKLCSFSGVPWTQTLGLMSLSGFFLNEIFLVIMGPPQSVPSYASILNFTEEEWESDGLVSIRTLITETQNGLQLGDTLVWLLLGAAHFALLLKSEYDVWDTLCRFLTEGGNPIGESLNNLIMWVAVSLYLCVYLHVIVAFVVYLVRLATGTTSIMPSYLSKYIVGRNFFLAYFINILLPTKENMAHKRWLFAFVAKLDAICFYPLGIFWLAHRVTRRAVKRWPRLGTGLFLVKLEVETDPNANGEYEIAVGEVVENKWLLFCFFVMNLATTIAWYASVYEEEGTVNPGWTEVFGR